MMRAVVLTLALLAAGGVSCTRVRASGGCSAAGQVDCRPTLKTKALDGSALADEQLEGHIVLVNFWATWCVPCARELPALEAVYKRHKADGFVIVGLLAADRASDDEVKNFAGMHGVDYPLVRSTADVESRFPLGDALPTSFLYDRTGRLRAQWNGAVREDVLEAKVREVLVQ